MPLLPQEKRTVKVAIVGSGLAGLSAGYLLTQPVEPKDGKDNVLLEVHLFEKTATIGMDASSVSVPVAKGLVDQDWRIDVPMRSFQGGYYPNVIALYRKLGVSFREANFSYSFSFMTQERQERRITTTMIYDGHSGRRGVSKPAILSGTGIEKGQRFVLYVLGQIWRTGVFLILTLQIVACFAITIWHSIPVRRAKAISTMTLGDWATEFAPRGKLAKWTGLDVAWGDYMETVFLPLMSAMTTSAEDDVLDHPVEEILDYCWLTFGTNHYVVDHGVRDVVSRLSSNLKHVHLSSAIISIRPDEKDSGLISLETSGGEVYSGFHHLVFATQASSAIPLLASYLNNLPSSAEAQRTEIMAQIRCLRAFKYRSTLVINHTDSSLLPDAVRDRRDLNLVTSGWPENEAEEKEELCVSSAYTMATHILPRPVGCPSHLPDIYQSTNPFVAPKKETIISASSLERAVLSCEAKEVLHELCKVKKQRWWECRTVAKCGLGSLQGAGGNIDKRVPGVWLCGSYAYLGVPLLEGCVVSARMVVEEGILEKVGMKLSREPWSI